MNSVDNLEAKQSDEWLPASIMWIDKSLGGRDPVIGNYSAPGYLYDENRKILPNMWSIWVEIGKTVRVRGVVPEGHEVLKKAASFQLFEGHRCTLVGRII